LDLIEESRRKLNRERKDIPLAVTKENFYTPGHTFIRGRIVHSRKIYRSSMSTLAKIWTSLMFTNIFPMTHVSYMTLNKAQLLYYILQGIIVDVDELISDEIHNLGYHKPLLEVLQSLLVFIVLFLNYVKNMKCEYQVTLFT